MNLTEIEVTAGRLLEEQKRLKTIDAELEVLSQEIKQDPKRNEKDQSFYALIGLDWSDPGHQDQQANLKKEREEVAGVIKEVEADFLRGISSEQLVIPLEPTPVLRAGAYSFSFRSGATFPKTVEELSATLGISTPLKLDDVTIYEDRVEVAEEDEFFAKKKIIEAFDAIRKTIKRKVAS